MLYKKSVDMWNAVAQDLNVNVAHFLRSKDTFSKVDDVHGHIKKMLSEALLNGLKKVEYPIMS